MKAKKNWSMELVGVCISGGGAVIHDIHRNPACNYSDSRIAPPTLRSTVTLTLHFAEGHQGGKLFCPAPRQDCPPLSPPAIAGVWAGFQSFDSGLLLRCSAAIRTSWNLLYLFTRLHFRVKASVWQFSPQPLWDRLAAVSPHRAKCL